MCQVSVTIITIKPEREIKKKNEPKKLALHKNKVVVLEYRDDTIDNINSLINKYHSKVSYCHVQK